ncbi:hypothetical protein C5C86_03165 [Rathayibacter sp. AY1E4]|nr:hypothetical protein C5C86_03165 [Rathayibacter sp. AY1E4]
MMPSLALPRSSFRGRQASHLTHYGYTYAGVAPLLTAPLVAVTPMTPAEIDSALLQAPDVRGED